MKKTILTVAALLIIAGGIFAYFHFQSEQLKPAPIVVEVEEIAPPTLAETTEPESRQVLDAPAKVIELPQLASSDDFIASALASLLNNKTLMAIFINDQLINNIVVTIDNLPRKLVSQKLMPIKKAPGKFIAMESEGGMMISPKNNARYTQYVQFAETINPTQLVELYIQLYPLFQKAYADIGYPDQYFNDRMMVVIDHLLATPDIDAPVPLVQPKFYYQYADADFESRSIGQRILMRIGSQNQSVIKDKLNAIKQALVLHMHEQRIDAVN